MYAVQAFGDKWRSLERRKDRQRQAFEAAISNATDLDLQHNLQEAADQVEQTSCIEVRCQTLHCAFSKSMHAIVIYSAGMMCVPYMHAENKSTRGG